MSIISKKYSHKDPFVEREFKSLVDQLNRQLQGKILNPDQIPRGLNAYNIPEDVTADRALDTEYINDRDKDQGRWVFIVVDLDASAAANSTAEVKLEIGYTTIDIPLGDPKIISGQNRMQVTLIGWIPNRYKYQVTKTVTNSGAATLISWVEMSWKYQETHYAT